MSSIPGGIECPGDCSETFAHNTEVTLTATPNATSSFVGWQGDPDCLDGSLSLLAETHCIAVFDMASDLIFFDGFESGTTDSWNDGLGMERWPR